MLHKLLGTILVVIIAIGCNEPTLEIEKVSLAQESLQSEVQDLKEQVSALALENERLKTQIDRLNLQIQDLYFMTEPLRIRVVDREEGNFYYADTGNNIWGMLPSQLLYAELWYLIRSAKGLGYSEEKTKGLLDKYVKMSETAYFTTYKPRYTFHKLELTYHPDLKGYVED